MVYSIKEKNIWLPELQKYQIGKNQKKELKGMLIASKILDIAEKDLENSFIFYEKQSTGLGSYFLDTIYSEIDSLSYFGGMHNKTNGFFRLITNKFPFAIYYKI